MKKKICVFAVLIAAAAVMLVAGYFTDSFNIMDKLNGVETIVETDAVGTRTVRKAAAGGGKIALTGGYPKEAAAFLGAAAPVVYTIVRDRDGAFVRAELTCVSDVDNHATDKHYRELFAPQQGFTESGGGAVVYECVKNGYAISYTNLHTPNKNYMLEIYSSIIQSPN